MRKFNYECYDMPHYIIYNSDKSKSIISDIIKDIKDDIVIDDESIFNIRLVLTELIKNSIEHSECNGNVEIWLETYNDENKVQLKVEDSGKGFDYRKIKLYPSKEDLYESRGRGLMIVNGLCESIKYNSSGSAITAVLKI